MGHYILSAVDFGGDASRKTQGPMVSALYFDWAFAKKGPIFPNGGLRLPCAEDGLLQFEPPRTVSACNAATLGGAMAGCPSGPMKSIMELHVTWGHVSAQQLKRVLVDSGSDLCG